MNKLRIGITIGDINGIGPELIIKTFQDSRMREMCIPIIYGSARVLNIYKKLFQIEKFHYNVIPNTAAARPGHVHIIECLPEVERVEIGNPSEIAGKCAYLALQAAIEDALHQNLDAIVTLPVDKATVRTHKADFSGHTEVFAAAFGAQDCLMFMVSEHLRVAVATHHISLKDVARNLSKQRIMAKAKMMIQSLKEDFSIDKPRIAVLGLNPHAGDDGILGREEKDMIQPALEQLQKEGHMVYGPYPADGFFGAGTYKKYDAVLAMYHDQGLIPFKLLEGKVGVNFTAALSFIRTSPDHGVAYDIAGRGIADETSFRNAVYLAIDVHRRRTENKALTANALFIEEKQTSYEEAHAARALFDDER